MLPNDTTAVELIPFTALEGNNNNGEAAEDYAYRQSSSSIPIMNTRPWNSDTQSPSSGSLEGTRLQLLWSKWLDIRDAITRRWLLLSKRRQMAVHVVFVLLGVLLIVMTIEYTVKTLHEKHVKPSTTTTTMIDDQEDYWMGDDDSEWTANTAAAAEIVIPEYDIPVNRVLCEQEIIPLFQLLDESLDHYCFQRNRMICSITGTGTAGDGADGEEQITLYERENVLYYPDGSLFDGDLSSPSLDYCMPTETETWSPLSPFSSDYHKVCQDLTIQQYGQDATPTNRFCTTTTTTTSSAGQANTIIDWPKVQEMVPKCLARRHSKNNNNNNNNGCNNLNGKIFQEILGGHLNCWEFQIAYLYLMSSSNMDDDNNDKDENNPDTTGLDLCQ